MASRQNVLFALCLFGGAAAGTAALVPRIVAGPTTLQVDSLPPGAELWIDGQLQGKTPARLAVEPGTRKLELRKSGFVPRQVEVQCKPSRTTPVAEKLNARPGTLRLQNAVGAELWLGPGVPRKLRGEGPWELPPGEYEVTGSRDKLPGPPRKFTLKAGEEVAVAMQWPTVGEVKLPPQAVPVPPPSPRPKVATAAPTPRPAARTPAAKPSAPTRTARPRPAYSPPVYRPPVYRPPARPAYRPAARPAYQPPPRAAARPAPAPLWTPLPAPAPPPSRPAPPEERLFTPLP